MRPVVSSRPRRRARKLALAFAGCVGLAACTLAGEPLAAAGETGPPVESSGAPCPSPNPPNMLAPVAGTPQTATLGSPFASALQVALANSDGCPVTSGLTGIPVTFSAPRAGAGGVFSASGSSSVTVGSDATGTATAPGFTANDTAGSYTLTASSEYGIVRFSLTNAAVAGPGGCDSALAGRPARIVAGVGATQRAPTGARFPIPLAVTVTDAEKNPVRGALVTFSAPTRGPSGGFAIHARGSHPRSVRVRTDGCGIAVAPPFQAGAKAGGYVVTATVADARPAAFALVNTGPGPRP